jgi:hypothetical protein
MELVFFKLFVFMEVLGFMYLRFLFMIEYFNRLIFRAHLKLFLGSLGGVILFLGCCFCFVTLLMFTFIVMVINSMFSLNLGKINRWNLKTLLSKARLWLLNRK